MRLDEICLSQLSHLSDLVSHHVSHSANCMLAAQLFLKQARDTPTSRPFFAVPADGMALPSEGDLTHTLTSFKSLSMSSSQCDPSRPLSLMLRPPHSNLPVYFLPLQSPLSCLMFFSVVHTIF